MTKTLVACGSHHLKSKLSKILQDFQITRDTTFTKGRAYQLLNKSIYHLAIIHTNLQDGNAIELIDFLHTSFYNTQILALIPSNLQTDKVRCLETGADECLPINCDNSELKLRISKLLSRYKIHQPHVLQLKDMTIYPQQGMISLGSNSFYLRKRELQILEFLCRHKNSVVSRQKIINAIWPEDEPRPTTIDSYIRRIRLILGKNHDYISTVWGFGYMIKEK